jgi:large subunit ribosomal protein L10
MNRQQKEHVVEALKHDFENSHASFLVGYKGLNVAQVLMLRKQLRHQGGSFKVAKVTLMKRVAHDMPSIEKLVPFFKDQVALVFAQQESPAIAKLLYDFAKENQQLMILAGCMDSVVLSKESVKILASLPSKEILLAQVCGTLRAPMFGLVSVLNMLILRLMFVLKKIEEKKASGSL